MKLRSSAVASVAIASLFLATMVGVAGANGGSTPISTNVSPSTTTVPMTFVGVSSKTQLANGMTELNLANGQVLTVASSMAALIRTSNSSGAPQPDNTVSGDCGSAEIYIYPTTSNTGITGETGFDVNGSSGDVVSFDWGVEVTNITYNRSQNQQWDEAYFLPSWYTTFDYIAGTGNYHSEVKLPNGGDGIVYTNEGVCESAGSLVHSDTIVS